MRRELVTVLSSAIPHRYSPFGVLYQGTQPSGRGALVQGGDRDGEKDFAIEPSIHPPCQKERPSQISRPAFERKPL